MHFTTNLYKYTTAWYGKIHHRSMLNLSFIFFCFTSYFQLFYGFLFMVIFFYKIIIYFHDSYYQGVMIS